MADPSDTKLCNNTDDGSPVHVNMENGLSRFFLRESTLRKRARASVAPRARTKRTRTVESSELGFDSDVEILSSSPFINENQPAASDAPLVNYDMDCDDCVVVEGRSARPTVMQFPHGRLLCLNKSAECDNCYCEICDIPCSDCVYWSDFHREFHTHIDFLSLMKEFALEERRHGRSLTYPARSSCSGSIFLSGALSNLKRVWSTLVPSFQSRFHWFVDSDWSSHLIHLIECEHGFEFMVGCILTNRFKFFNDILTSTHDCGNAQWAVVLANAVSYSNMHNVHGYVDNCHSTIVQFMCKFPRHAISMLCISCHHASSLRLFVDVLTRARAVASTLHFHRIVWLLRHCFLSNGRTNISAMISCVPMTVQFVKLLSETSDPNPTIELDVQWKLHSVMLMDFYSRFCFIEFVQYYEKAIASTEAHRSKFAFLLMDLMKRPYPSHVRHSNAFMHYILLHTLRR
jgi:hypothetical protein